MSAVRQGDGDRDTGLDSQGLGTEGLGGSGSEHGIAAALAIPVPILPGTIACGEISRRFEARDAPPAFAIQADGRFGLIDRISCLGLFARQYGRELFERRPVTTLMESDPLVVPDTMPVQEISTAIATQKPTALTTGFVITRGGAYLGIGLGLDLMRLIAREMEEAYRDLHAAQASLVEAEKFASLGQLVAGIAHEVNTPVGVGLTAASHLRERTVDMQRKVASNQLRRADFDGFLATSEEASAIIQLNLERAAGLIQSFKQVAVDQTSMRLMKFPLPVLIEDTLASLRGTLKQGGHQVVVTCPPALDMVSYPGSLTQILTNLIMNAMTHAYDAGTAGVMTIAVTERDGQVALRFADDGKGVPAEILPRIFEPFFTTRRGQGGSGLGLHIVYNLVTQSLAGRLDCESTPGRGTCFTITMPKVLEAVETRRTEEIRDDARP